MRVPGEDVSWQDLPALQVSRVLSWPGALLEEVVGGAVARRYVYGMNRISQTQAGVTSLYDYDAHGDVRALMSTAPVAPDSYATPTDTYDYGAFGNLIGSTGTTPNVYRYQGEALDEETGLYYFRARYYDPVAGRFLTVDPLAGQGEHPYEYAGADPVNGHDPTGQQDAVEYALIMAYFLPPPMRVPPPPNRISCWGGIIFSATNPVELAAKMAACFQKGSSRSGGGKSPTQPSPTQPPKPCVNSPVYDPGVWNASGIVDTNNCYTYGWGVPLAFPPAWRQPGGRSGSMVQKPLTCSGVKAAAVRDGYMYTDNASCCPEGYHSVVLVIGDHVHAPNSVIDIGQDYHWYRQDSNGSWSSKHGLTRVGEQVADPFVDARSWGYDQPCGRMCAPDQLH